MNWEAVPLLAGLEFRIIFVIAAVESPAKFWYERIKAPFVRALLRLIDLMLVVAKNQKIPLRSPACADERSGVLDYLLKACAATIECVRVFKTIDSKDYSQCLVPPRQLAPPASGTQGSVGIDLNAQSRIRDCEPVDRRVERPCSGSACTPQRSICLNCRKNSDVKIALMSVVDKSRIAKPLATPPCLVRRHIGHSALQRVVSSRCTCSIDSKLNTVALANFRQSFGFRA